MEGYILTGEGYVLTRVILWIFMLVHCCLGYGGRLFHFCVSPKLYHGFFITDAVALTAFIVWCCINEPFKMGIGWAALAYLVAYALILICWALLRHLMISHTEVYRMVPQYRINFEGNKGIEGSIKTGGLTQTVLLLDEELHDSTKGWEPINVRFVSYAPPQLSERVDAVVEAVKE